MAELNRLFFALQPMGEVRNACAEAARDLKLRAQPGGYLSAPDLLHITLLFLGDFVPEAQQQLAVHAAGRVRSAPFTLRLDQASSFRNNRQIPWWLGPRERPPALDELYRRLREAMSEAGVSVDRMKFVPHLTVIRDAQRALADTAIKPIAWEVQEFVLLRSLLNQRPVVYEVLGRWSLIEGAAPAAAQLKLF